MNEYHMLADIADIIEETVKECLKNLELMRKNKEEAKSMPQVLGHMLTKSSNDMLNRRIHFQERVAKV